VTCGIGVDQLPISVRQSKLLNGNDLGRLGNVEKLPSQEVVNASKALEKEAAVNQAIILLKQDKKMEALALLIKNI
jgi:hypothetical protein